MNVLRSSKQPVRHTKPQPAQLSRLAISTQRGYQARALEVTVMLAVNLLLSATAVVALTQLIPYQKSQQEKLQEMQSQVKVAQGQVSQVKEQFDRNFDPQQARQIMQEQTNRIDPQQRHIILVHPDNEADK